MPSEPADVPRGTSERLERLVALVAAENERQNLIARSTLPDIWRRHVEDSLQLLPLAPPGGSWIDVGTGAGFPGLAIAIAQGERRMTLIEPRRRRADFLASAAAELACTNVQVLCMRAEQVTAAPAAVISARAVSALDTLFAAAAHLADATTVWLLPKGRSAANELEVARRTWQGRVRLVPSVTDPEAAIIVADGVRRKRAE